MTRYVGIDPSTKTGFVALDEYGDIWDSQEIEGQGKDPERMVKLIDRILRLVSPEDIVCIEDFAYAQANRMAMLGGIGWGIRMELFKRGITYMEVATGQLKNFAGCKGNCSKDDLIIPIYELWGFKNGSDNVRDAFILAQIARAIKETVKLKAFQRDVIKKVRGR